MNKSNPRKMKQSPAQRFKKNNLSVFVWILFIVGTLYLMGLLQNNGVARKELSYTEFYRVLTEEPSRLKVVTMSEDILQGEFVNGSRFFVNIPPDDKDLLALLRTHAPDFQVKPARTIWTNLLFSLGPVVLFIAFLWYFSYRGAEVGNRIWSFGKVKARLGTEPKEKVTFADVAGVDEAKEELQEVIEFLKDPKKFQRLGGKIPKGVLLVGPPGCGKTLIAKAVAGEANVPFFNISGSDFVEMFVGVGASRVRDLFEQARKAAKTFGRGAIIFIDEIDAVGRLRFSGIGGGHDEREQTLNQLLVEMDGFDPQEGIILIAATNRPDTLDPALLRPGRFDRHVVIDRPDIKGREAILKVHSANIKLAADVGLEAIARQTPGFSGADLANLCNEAALLAARYDKEAVGKKEMEAAIERVVAGPERKSRVISPKEKEIVAFHEAGHTLVSLLTPEVDPLHKVSIIPRGVAALGYTLQLPLQDRYIMMKSELIGRITVLLAGRASENLYFQDITTGSENDIEVATQMARRMVCEFGMSEKIGYLTLGHRQGLIFLGKNLSEERNYSDETAKIIDDEIKAIIDSCYDRARLLLEQNKDKLTLLANTLREREVMDAEEVKKLLGFAL
ncbi:ATP-dependent zinc metalloprotease FtsH [Candidatus Velamenicoccus archaeovorus]|nr:ATP-dependent zinc metalloprotease FtsH [Candidatus Velamenicoccus archaeovorus]